MFSKDNPDELMKAFLLLISKGKLSNYARTIASSGKLLAKNMQASECIAGYVKLLDNVLTLPSDSVVPGLLSPLEQVEWEWDLFLDETDQRFSNLTDLNLMKATRSTNVVYDIEEHMTPLLDSRTMSQNDINIMGDDVLTELDWDGLHEIDSLEEVERIELEEV